MKLKNTYRVNPRFNGLIGAMGRSLDKKFVKSRVIKISVTLYCNFINISILIAKKKKFHAHFQIHKSFILFVSLFVSDEVYKSVTLIQLS
jgi:hypothetical protein